LKLLKGQIDHTPSESNTPIPEHRPKLPLAGSLPLNDQSDLPTKMSAQQYLSEGISANGGNEDKNNFESSDDLFS